MLFTDLQPFSRRADTTTGPTMPRRILLTLLAAAWTFHASTVSAQDDRSRIMGTVIDTSGGALPGVTVTVTGAALAPTPVFTDNAGRYLTPWVPPGTYNVVFELSGF